MNDWFRVCTCTNTIFTEVCCWAPYQPIPMVDVGVCYSTFFFLGSFRMNGKFQWKKYEKIEEKPYRNECIRINVLEICWEGQSDSSHTLNGKTVTFGRCLTCIVEWECRTQDEWRSEQTHLHLCCVLGTASSCHHSTNSADDSGYVSQLILYNIIIITYSLFLSLSLHIIYNNNNIITKSYT